MSFSDILQSITDAFDRAWARARFIFDSYPKTIVLIGLALTAGVVIWASTGFSLQIGRFFASGGGCDDGNACTNDFPDQSCEDPSSGCNVCYHTQISGCTGGTTGGGTTGGANPAPTNTPVSPHSYCDYATNSCKTATSTDWNAPQCSAGGSCAPGNCRVWTGSGTTWSPSAGTGETPACEPLSQIPGTTITGYVGAVLNPGRTGFPDCFIANTYSSQDPNFGTFAGVTGDTVPVVLKDRPNAKLFYRAFVVNNCPWKVHMVLQTDGSAKASTDIGAGKRDKAVDGAGFVTFNMPNGFDIPSCWNSGGAMPKDCAREVSVDFNLNAFTCGSVGLQIEWVHLTTAGGGTAGGIKDPQGAGTATSLNYGRDCSGSQAERAPGGTGTGGATGASCTTPPQPANLTVQCGTAKNVLTWTNPANTCLLSVLRGVNGGNATFLASNLPLNTTTYTDSDVQAGRSATYRIKNNPSVTSNEVTCKDGVLVTTTSPSTAPTAAPTVIVQPGTTTIAPAPTTTVTVVPTVIVVVPTCQPSDAPTGDLDCDGVPNNVECPGYTVANGVSQCPDTNADGIPDIIEPDVQNYGGGAIPPTPIPPGGNVGGVQTGPGDATVLALVASAVVSLGYVSYTRSPLGRRRELVEITEDQSPMDFRS